MALFTQYNLRWLHQKAGLSRFGPAGCLTELGIVHQGVARQVKSTFMVILRNPLMVRGTRRSFHPETLLFPDVETAGFQFGIEQFFLLARKSSIYEEAYINTLTNNCED